MRFPSGQKPCARWASVVFPDNLTLPGTVGRGFCFLCETVAHGYLCITWVSV